MIATDQNNFVNTCYQNNYFLHKCNKFPAWPERMTSPFLALISGVVHSVSYVIGDFYGNLYVDS